MAEMHIQIFSEREMKTLNGYMNQYGIEVDSLSKSYELDVVAAVLKRINKTQSVYDFRNELLGSSNLKNEMLFNKLNGSDLKHLDEKLSQISLENQIILEKHITGTLISGLFSLSICENHINDCVHGSFADPELRKNLLKPSAKLYLMKNASLNVREHVSEHERKLNRALLDVHRIEILCAKEINDAIEDIQIQLNEIVYLLVMMSVLKLTQIGVIKCEQDLNKIVIFSRDIMVGFAQELYNKVKVCHEIRAINRKLRNKKYNCDAQFNEWLRIKNDLLIKRKYFKGKLSIISDQIKNNDIKLRNTDEIAYLENMSEFNLYALAKKSISLINQRIELEYFIDSYYSKVVSSIFQSDVLKDDEFAQKTDNIKNKINTLKTYQSCNNTEIRVVSGELHLLTNELVNKIQQQRTNLKILNPASNTEFQQQKNLFKLLDKMCLELYHSLK